MTGAADANANIIFGAVINDGMKDEVRVTVIATGFGPQRRKRERKERERKERERGRVLVPQAVPERREREGVDVPAEVLELPSFLRDS